jgi:hypothetical protein
MHHCYTYFENNNYSAISHPSNIPDENNDDDNDDDMIIIIVLTIIQISIVIIV